MANLAPTAEEVLAALSRQGQSKRRITASIWLARNKLGDGKDKKGSALARCESLLDFEGVHGGEVLLQLLKLLNAGVVDKKDGEQAVLWRKV